MTNSAPCNSTDALLSKIADLFDGGVCLTGTALRVDSWSEGLSRRGARGPAANDTPLRQVLAPLFPDCTDLAEVLSAAERAATETMPLSAIARASFPGPLKEEFEVLVGSRCETPGVVLLFRPVSEQHLLEARYKRILDSMPDGIMIMDPTRKVLVINEACGRLLGRDPAEVMRTNCVCGEVTDCHLPDGRTLSNHLCPAREVFAGVAEPQTEQMLATDSGGRERWIETSYSPILNRLGEVEFVIGVMRDIHERKTLEARLQQTEKLASLGALTAGIAHEIKNPLGIILSSVEILLDEERPRDMHREAASFIREEVQRLDQRLRAFLQFARPQPPLPEAVVLGGLIRRTVQSLESSLPKLAMELDLCQPDPIVKLDPDQFRQVITNMVLNSAEALEDEAGRVLIRTRERADGVAVVEFHDDGPGIPAKAQAQLFDPFFTTKAAGTGLGLSVVFQIVSEASGRIEAGRSELGGALFRIELPGCERLES